MESLVVIKAKAINLIDEYGSKKCLGSDTCRELTLAHPKAEGEFLRTIWLRKAQWMK